MTNPYPRILSNAQTRIAPIASIPFDHALASLVRQSAEIRRLCREIDQSETRIEDKPAC